MRKTLSIGFTSPSKQSNRESPHRQRLSSRESITLFILFVCHPMKLINQSIDYVGVTSPSGTNQQQLSNDLGRSGMTVIDRVTKKNIRRKPSQMVEVSPVEDIELKNFLLMMSFSEIFQLPI